MGFIKGLLNIPFIPLDVITDAATTVIEEATMTEEKSKSRTEKRIERIQENLEDGDFL